MRPRLARLLDRPDRAVFGVALALVSAGCPSPVQLGPDEQARATDGSSAGPSDETKGDDSTTSGASSSSEDGSDASTGVVGDSMTSGNDGDDASGIEDGGPEGGAGETSDPSGPSCGDGIHQPDLGEECDTAGDSATCDANCSLPTCGDGHVNVPSGETCDDGAQNGEPGQCSAMCGFVCTDACPLIVDPAATTAGDGSTWASPMIDLVAAINLAQANSREVWVREGSITSSVGGSEFIVLRPGVRLYGGFVGTEIRRSERPPEGRTSLSAGTSDRVVVGSSQARLEGFTIRDGAAVFNGSGRQIVDGGGMSNVDVEDLVIANCTFVDNEAIERGGAMHNEGSRITIENSTFIRNVARDAVTTPFGGAISNVDSEVSIRNSHFEANTAPFGGGALYNVDSQVTIEDTTFVQNSTTGAGGRGGAISSSGGSLRIVGSRFEANEATPGDFGSGGAILDESDDATIQSSTFVDNVAGSQGGALMNGAGTSRVSDCVFERNSAQEGAGAITHLRGTPLVEDSIFVDNRSSFGPAGVHNLDTPAVIRNSLFYGHFGFGSVIENDGTTSARIVQCTIADNECGPGTGCSVRSVGTAEAIIQNSVLSVPDNRYTNVSGAATITGSCVLFEAGLGSSPRPFVPLEDADDDGYPEYFLDQTEARGCYNGGVDADADAAGIDWRSLTTSVGGCLDSSPVDPGVHYVSLQANARPCL